MVIRETSAFGFGNQGPFHFENDAWVGSLGFDFSYSTLDLKFVDNPFSTGDVVTDLVTGATCSVVEAGAITYASEAPYQSLVITGINGSFNSDDAVSGTPSGGSATVSNVNIASPGNYDMKLWMAYQVIDVS